MQCFTVLFYEYFLLFPDFFLLHTYLMISNAPVIHFIFTVS